MGQCPRTESTQGNAALRPTSRRARSNQRTALRAEYESQAKSETVQWISGEWGGQVGKGKKKRKVCVRIIAAVRDHDISYAETSTSHDSPSPSSSSWPTYPLSSKAGLCSAGRGTSTR
jgi:hypothetical protein